MSGKSPALDDTAAPALEPTAVGVPVTAAERSSLASYRTREVLGRGGMGEVILAEDLEIGRNVAIKRLRSEITSPALIDRFLREARIQALLDHPAIVPVHEIGRDADGRPFFTMKRLSGITLAEAIKANSETTQRMLRAFTEVCHAIELAHARGFIHRDLKPSNIMLGELGEVYVIDWGLARAAGETDPPRLPSGLGSGSLGGDTQAGVVMGTPGYMSPEQTHGDEVGPPTDVYALGAILFEILARQKAHPIGTKAAVASTLAGGRISPADVAPDRGIPPELDQLCSEALADEPSQRPTARTLALRVQRYLDGDRDLGRRRTLAMELVAIARVDLASGDPARRGSAIKSAGRALALDPENEAAAAIVAKLMIEPPPVMPPELAQRLADIDLEQGRSQGKRAIGSLCAYFLFLPISIWMGVRDPGMVALLYALIGATIVFAVVRLRYPRLPMAIALVLNACMLLALSRVTSPFLIVPTLAVGIGILFAMFPELLRVPWVVLGASVSALVLPMVFEAAGWWRETWKLEGGQFVADPSVVTFDGTAGKVFLIGITVATAIVFPLFVRALAIAQRKSRRQLEVQAWHLQHLVPTTPS